MFCPWIQEIIRLTGRMEGACTGNSSALFQFFFQSGGALQTPFNVEEVLGQEETLLKI